MQRLPLLKEIFSKASFLALSDMRAQYRNSFLGPFWVVIGLSVGMVGLSYVWSKLFQIKFEDFIPSLVIGMVLWQFMNGVLLEGASFLTSKRSIILNSTAPLYFLVVQLLFRHILNFAHLLLMVVAVLVIFSPPSLLLLALSALGFILVAALMYNVAYIIGFIGARFRDIPPLLGSVMPLVFIASPILYKPAQIGLGAAVVRYNPLTYLLSVFRDPLLGTVPPLSTYGILLALLLFLILVAFFVIRPLKKNLPYWL